MNTPRGPHPPDTGWYRIRVQGRLAPRWAIRFDGMELAPQDDGTTLIQGRVADQAALHGLLQQVRDSGLSLISVTRAAGVPPTAHTTDPADTQHERRSPT